jgi:phosphoglycerate dehydrogenase-like enzyme
MKRGGEMSMTRTVLSLAPLPGELVELLIRQTPDVPDFQVIPGHDMQGEDLMAALASADIVLGDYTFRHMITGEHLAAARRLKFIQQPSVGYQHIDVDACTSRGIKVANTGGANTVSVAEHTIAWGLFLMKNLYRAHTSTKAGAWEQMGIKPSELMGKVWGIIGFGRIGRAVAERLKPFHLGRILYFDTRRAEPAEEQEFWVEYMDFQDILPLADIISLHAPLMDETRGMFGEKAFNAIKQGSYLINVARAELVDEQALAKAIRQGKLAGAGIDVFQEEPVAADNPLLGVESDRLLLSPHVAGVTNEAAGRIINMAAANIARVLKGEEPESVVNQIPGRVL